jgi:hypothetical protein
MKERERCVRREFRDSFDIIRDDLMPDTSSFFVFGDYLEWTLCVMCVKVVMSVKAALCFM